MKDKNLQKLGIKVIRELTEKEKRFISNYMADKLREKYPYLKYSYLDIVFILYNTSMYVCKKIKNMSSVNYVYQNQSIYFSEDNDILDIDEFTIHECIHRIQDRRTKKGKLMQMGNCEFTDTQIKGLSFNEIAIQYIVANLLNKTKKRASINNLIIKTVNPQYYPLISNLMEQLVLLLGEKELIQSTICGNNDFNYQIIDYIGEKEFFEIRINFDKMLELQDQINSKNRENNTEQIKEIYYNTQKLIYENYFIKTLNYINMIQEVENTKKKLEEYAKFIHECDRYNEFEIFYKKTQDELEKINKNLKSKYALVPIKNGFWNKLTFKIQQLLSHENNG